MFKVESLSFGHHSPLFQNVAFHCQAGEIWGILGPNGVGKTTLFRTLLGILPPLSGKVSYPWKKSELPLQVGYLPQRLTPPMGFSVWEVVEMGRFPKRGDTKRDRQAIQKALESMELLSFASRSAEKLSGGEQQRLFLAQLIAQEPSLFLLDEPFSQLDLKHCRSLKKLFLKWKKEGKTILFSTHELEHLQICDQVILMGKNFFKVGDPNILSSENLQKLFSLSLHICLRPNFFSIEYREER